MLDDWPIQVGMTRDNVYMTIENKTKLVWACRAIVNQNAGRAVVIEVFNGEMRALTRDQRKSGSECRWLIGCCLESDELLGKCYVVFGHGG